MDVDQFHDQALLAALRARLANPALLNVSADTRITAAAQDASALVSAWIKSRSSNDFFARAMVASMEGRLMNPDLVLAERAKVVSASVRDAENLESLQRYVPSQAVDNGFVAAEDERRNERRNITRQGVRKERLVTV